MWKKKVSSSIHLKNKLDLLSMLETYKKLDKQKMKEEEYGQKSYLRTMNLSSGRTFFSARASMLSTVKANFKSDPRYAGDFRCECLEHEDDQASLLTCRLYERHRDGLDLLNSDEDLVTYYKLIIDERRKKAEQLRIN